MKLVNKMWLPDGDIFFETKGDYELTDYLKAKSYFKQHRLAIDIGAHVGFWSKRLVEDFDIVYAFEPDQEHVECLRMNVSSHRLVVNNTALSHYEGSITFNKYIDNSGMSRVSDQGTKVNCKTLDSYRLRCVDFIKIDVEGHELNVLEGSEQTLDLCRPVLFIEILHNSDPTLRQLLFNYIARFNYNMVDIIDENYIFVHV